MPSFPNSFNTIEESVNKNHSRGEDFKTKAGLSNGPELRSKEIERKLIEIFESYKQEVTKELTKMHLK